MRRRKCPGSGGLIRNVAAGKFLSGWRQKERRNSLVLAARIDGEVKLILAVWVEVMSGLSLTV
jgi:hypothetical protein